VEPALPATVKYLKEIKRLNDDIQKKDQTILNQAREIALLKEMLKAKDTLLGKRDNPDK